MGPASCRGLRRRVGDRHPDGVDLLHRRGGLLHRGLGGSELIDSTFMPEASRNSAATGQALLHGYVPFDWGDEIDLGRARGLVPASYHAFPRRRRTPTSFPYRPPPLHVGLGPVKLDLPEVGTVEAAAGVTLFDFAAVSVAFRIPLALTADALLSLA